MKKFFILSLVTFMAFTVQAETWSFGGGTMYFDNSTTQWNEANMMLVIGNECWSEVVEMQLTEQANLWKADLPIHWNGPSYMAILNDASIWGAGVWGSANLSNTSHYSAAYEGGIVSVSEEEYIFVPQSAENGCTLVLYRKGEEPQPDPDPETNRLEDGFYLITDAMEWNVANVTDATMFTLNTGAEYKLTTDLTEGLKIKVIKVVNDAAITWYPDGMGTEYTINAAHAGEAKVIYFQEAYKGDWASFGGYFWIDANQEPDPDPDPSDLTNWFLPGNFIDDEWSSPTQMEIKENGAENTVYATLTLPAAKEYEFKIKGYNIWYGHSGMMTQANHTGWPFGSDISSNCAMATTIAGEYIFALDTTTMTLTVNYPDNPKQATLYDSPVKDQNTDVMLQAFYWAHVGNTAEEYTEFGDVKWSALNAEAEEIAASFDLVWLAPSQETADYTGYLPINYGKQGEVSGNTEGHSPWGSAQDLRNLIDNLHHGGAKVIADIVLNHSSASHTDEYPGPNYNWCHWNTFDFGQYGQFNPDYTWICKGDEMFYSKKTVHGNEDCGYSDNTNNDEDEMTVSYKGGQTYWAESEFNCMYSRDWAHKKKEVREMSRAFLTWMRDSIGYDGFRYDFMKGIHGSHLYDYNCASAPYFSVAELFDGDIDKQLGFLEDAHKQTYVFDFPGKFTIYDQAIREYKLQNLKGNSYTLIYGPYKKYAVTFCDNHDSFHEEGKSLNYHANTIDARQAHQALAYLLSMPGVPCVMYPYWHEYKAECQAFIQARRAVGVHSESTVKQDWAGSGEMGDNYYTALIEGTNGYLFLKLGYDSYPTEAPKVAAPEGKKWKCAWANNEDAGVWYTVDADTPTNVESTRDNQQGSKVLKEGVVYIQRDEQVYTVQGQPMQ